MATIDRPGIFDNVTDDEYERDPVVEPSVRSSILKTMIEKSPLHAAEQHPRLNPKWEHEDDDKFDLGTAAHDWLLRGEDRITVIPFDNYKTNAAKAAKLEARKAGRIPLIASKSAEVFEMVDAVRSRLAQHQEAADAFTNGRPELTMVWKEEVDGVPVWCRCKPDWFPTIPESLVAAGATNPPDLIIPLYDFKSTTDASSGEFRKRIGDLGHDVSIMFHIRGIEKLTGLRLTPRFVVAETKRPYGVNVIQLSQRFIDTANRKIDYGLSLWAHCISTGRFNGYAPFISYVDPMPWHETDFEEKAERRRFMREELGKLSKKPLPAGFIDNFAV